MTADRPLSFVFRYLANGSELGSLLPLFSSFLLFTCQNGQNKAPRGGAGRG
jgi:hypothetical protein